jgi:hypothetical protein
MCEPVWNLSGKRACWNETAYAAGVDPSGGPRLQVFDTTRLSFQRKPEYQPFESFCAPAFAGVTVASEASVGTGGSWYADQSPVHTSAYWMISSLGLETM